MAATMTLPTDPHRVFIVDDDAGVRDSLAWLLRTRGLCSDGFESAEAFLTHPCWQSPPTEPCCLLLDVRMGGMSGLAVFSRLLELPWATQLPVIFLSGHADVATAVDAVKRGAFDFCEKPFSDNALVDRVSLALEASAQALAHRDHQLAMEERVNQLTDRERDVMEWIMAGLSNKQVADQLAISVRTVEVHRARIFEKMGVKSAVELVNNLKIK